jgi:hypothetical protein
MAELQLTPPNTCAVIDLGEVPAPASPVIYIAEGTGYNAKIGVPDSYTSFQQFTNPDDALAAARVIDPSYPANNILGPLLLTPVNVSDETQNAYAGTDLTLHCEYECADATVTYQWKNPGGLIIPSATTSSFTLSNLTEKLDGTYTCVVSASNAKGQTGSATGSFAVTVYPSVGAVAE